MSALTKLLQKGRPRSFLDKSCPQGPIIRELQDKVDLHDSTLVLWPLSTVVPTVPTAAGTLEITLIAPFTGVLTGGRVCFKDALTAHDTNFVTFAIVNKGNSNAAMLAATDPNTTKLTGGAALVAFTTRTLVLNGTAANLKVTAGDVLALQFTGAGTLANTLTEGSAQLKFNPVG